MSRSSKKDRRCPICGNGFFRKEKYDGLVYHVSTAGDPSVGIPSVSFTVALDGLTFKEITDGMVNGKEELRKALQEFWGEWVDNGRTVVYFEGETE